MIAGAASAAQILAFAAAPILARLYTPHAFGHFAAFGAMVTILCPLVTLRYDWALPLPKDEEAALDILALCAILVMAFSAVSLAAAAIVSAGAPTLARWSGFPSADLVLLPLAIGAVAANGAAASWLTRTGAFAAIARARFATSAGIVAGQVLLGWMGWGARGLILGFLGGYALGCAVQAGQIGPDISRCLRRVSLANLRRAAATYRRFAAITAPCNVVNAVGFQLPSLALPALYGLASAGQYALAQRVLAQPASLVGQAVNQVYWGNAARLLREDPARLLPLFIGLNAALFAVMAPGLILIWFGPDLFAIIFGTPWREAGAFAGVLVISTFIGLAAQATTSLHVYGFNHWMGAWEVLQLALVAIALGATRLGLDVFSCVVALTAALALANAALLALNAFAVRRAARGAAHPSGAAAPEMSG